MVFVPRTYIGAPVPLVAHVHPTMSVHRPFLKSLIVAHPFDVEALCQQAEKNGFALLWPWARGNSRGNSIGTADTFEALAAVQREFNIDEDKIYLEGTCEGGSEALLLAARFPHRFAAVAAIAPITDETTMGDSVARRPNAPPRLARWSRINSPMALATNLSNMPVMIVHGQHDEMVPLSHSETFVDECRRSGLQPHFLVLPNTGHSYAPVEPINLVMDFFQGKSRVHSPEHVILSTSSTQYGSAYWVKISRINQPLVLARLEASRKQTNMFEVNAQNVEAFALDLEAAGIQKGHAVTVMVNGAPSFKGASRSRWLSISLRRDHPVEKMTKCSGVDGSIDQAVGTKFIFVDPGERMREVEPVRRMLRAFWREEYFVDLPSISSAQRRLPSNCAANAIVVLSPQTDSRNVVDHIEGVPALIERQRISLGDRRYDGDGLAFQMVYPHPRCPGKYLVVMGVTDTTSRGGSRFYSPTSAWYDFIIWRLDDSKSDPIVDVGLFDANWRKTISLREEIY
jgi:pimeloyl-ACP methyl ester carboxylesterase